VFKRGGAPLLKNSPPPLIKGEGLRGWVTKKGLPQKAKNHGAKIRG